MDRLAWPFSMIIVLALAPVALRGQAAVVAVEEENFRVTPNGQVIAELLQGTPLVVGRSEGQWRSATLEAWIWAPSVEADSQDGHDLRVSVGAGENLRAAPNGERIGRARPGMLLDRVEQRDNWIRVRRTAWIWGPSIRTTGARPVARPATGPGVRTPTREFITAGPGAVVHAAPAGDTVAQLQPGASVEVLGRDGDWARVRVEGWTFAASLGADTASATIVADLTREALQDEPEQFRGRLLEWTVQFIALQEAERFRTDFLAGEPFILARGPGDDAGFVYLAVPAELLDEVAALTPLQRIRVVGRVRSAQSSLTGAPVLDLMEITGR